MTVKEFMIAVYAGATAIDRNGVIWDSQDFLPKQNNKLLAKDIITLHGPVTLDWSAAFNKSVEDAIKD